MLVTDKHMSMTMHKKLLKASLVLRKGFTQSVWLCKSWTWNPNTALKFVLQSLSGRCCWKKKGQTAIWKQKALEARSLNCFQGLYQIGGNPFFCDELLTVCVFLRFWGSTCCCSRWNNQFFFSFFKGSHCYIVLDKKNTFPRKWDVWLRQIN